MVPNWVTKFIFFKFRSVINSATGWTVRVSNPAKGRTFLSETSKPVLEPTASYSVGTEVLF